MHEEGMSVTQAAQVLLTKEVAFLLGISEVTVRLWEKQGKLTANRASGGVRLFDLEEVQEVARRLKAQRQKPHK